MKHVLRGGVHVMVLWLMLPSDLTPGHALRPKCCRVFAGYMHNAHEHINLNELYEDSTMTCCM